MELTSTAVSKVKEVLSQQEPQPRGLGVSVVGGGCSGFSYQMNFENESKGIDKVLFACEILDFLASALIFYGCELALGGW